MRKILTAIFFFFLFLKIRVPVFAVCPLCTVAVGAGVGLCRYLGIDDTISGAWIGGLITSLGLWLSDFLKKKNFKIPYLPFFSLFLSSLFIFLPLFWFNFIGIPGNTFWGIDKIILGIGSGIIVFLLAVLTDKFLRQKNNGKVLFYYQKVILPVLYLSILSYIFYLITC